ncbi:DUF1102 domain-containing protein [Natronolimnohabitans sp. A-GB9]|uniref:DUF1102 domain-containing protein n=1 Tax=Natronolimnohabitans sp. A-GB9 TaxID=3069757 RepID=UPI0027B85749|nr:DUF1102 domain-containing protein [Natronolimnohabitans sp. A-GB9]MDQ2051019.1 DUF1102 domain-containing protein [Natronolimnohabitans sp. A-GB9]
MQRRKFVIGMGALASGAAAAVGTGAFSSVTATRDVEVEVADDASAYLRLEGSGGDNSEYVTDDGDGGTLEIQLNSSNETEAGGEGVNPDAVTKIDDLFVVENQGTQEVDVGITKTGDNAGLVEFYPDDGDYDSTPLSDSDETLEAGGSTSVSIKVDTEGEDVDNEDELLESVTFNADASN